MSSDHRIGIQKTLGELVLGLAPGESCPWCEGRLRSEGGAHQESVVGRVESGRDIESPALSCPECGSRMDTCQPEAGAGGARSLGAAA